MCKTILPLVLVAFASCESELGTAPKGAQDEAHAAARVQPAAVLRPDGTLERPRGYRRWVHVGTPLTPNDMNDGHAAFPEFHTVYIDPSSYDAYKRTGAWRDGTVMIKELTGVGGKAASSGRGYFQGEFIGLEASVKSARQFPDEPGNWGFFRFTDEAGGPVHRTAEPQPTTSCAACHWSGADHDSVFTQYYPVLRAAKASGNSVPEDL